MSSARHQLALEVIEAYRSWDIERIMANRADNCIHQVAPKSLRRPARDNAAYRAWFATTLMPFFRGFEPTVHDLVVDERANKATVFCSSRSETVLGLYENEYVILLHFNEAGDKVERLVEFVDSGYSAAFFQRLEKALAEKEKEKEKDKDKDKDGAAKLS